MKFRTEIQAPKFNSHIEYNEPILFMGSCFSTNIHQKLTDLKFQSLSNPFGIVYNPVSLSKQLNRLLSQRPYTSDELHFHNERWFSFDHHSDFSSSNKEDTLRLINASLTQFGKQISSAKHLFITLGSSWTYHHKELNETVSNCHKLPSSTFTKELRSVEEMVLELQMAIQKLKLHNPKLQVILSTSPIRHLSDGFFENQLSKGRLFDVIYQLTHKNESVHYFPAYEIVMDDLRDYRFYTHDLVHPSQEGIDYIWEKFIESFVSPVAQETMKTVTKLSQAASHRPFDSTSKAHQKFVKNTISKMESLPTLNFQKELSLLKSQLL